MGIEELDQAESILRQARHAAGLAAHHYFFLEATPHAYDAYRAAMEAEVEAELLLAVLAAEHH